MKKKSEIILILGGVRSGKSDYAVNLAKGAGKNILYCATGSAGDDEMKKRIEKHKKQRPASWKTIEAQTDIGRHISTIRDNVDAVIIDCLTMLAANILMNERDTHPDEIYDNIMKQELDDILDACSLKKAPCIIVSNEVGMGIVPVYKSGRVYRDILGMANKHVAARADKVILMLAGLPVDIKKITIGEEL